MIDSATGLLLVCNQHILAIQVKDPELLSFAMGHRGMAVIQHCIPA